MEGIKMASEFARCLAQLLDETCLFTRLEWSQFFGQVSEEDLEAWTQDEKLPTADLLRRMMDCLTHNNLSEELAKNFYDMARKPSSMVSPHHIVLGFTVGIYLLQPRVEGILRRMSRLSVKQQEAILDKVVLILDEALVK